MALWDAGYEPFPLAPNSKIAVVRWRRDWDERHFQSRDQVADWWTRHPDHNVGVNCEASALLAVDLDGPAAAARFADLWYEHQDAELADYGTPVIRTPRPGLHYYFTMPHKPLRNTAGKLGEGIDTRGAGGMVVGPGSVIDGVSYGLVSGRLEVTRPLPGSLEELLRWVSGRSTRCAPPTVSWPRGLSISRLAQARDRVAAALPGYRNPTLNTQAWGLRPALAALGYEAIEEVLFMASEANGLVAEDGIASVRATIRSGLGGRWDLKEFHHPSPLNSFI